jgi:predicted nucleic acid-binding protein
LIALDASVALSWCLFDETSERGFAILERVSDEGAAAPAHWPLEVANGLMSAERRGRIEESGIADARRMLDELQIEIVPIELTTAIWSVLDSARTHQLSLYDAAYLDLARFRGIPLATMDERLSEACRNAGVELVD